jgi:hypothetical protein
LGKIVISLLFNLLICFFCFFILGGRKYNYMKEGYKAYEVLSKQAQARVNAGIHILFKVIAILILCVYVLPFLLDIPTLVSGKYKTVEGKPTEISKGSFNRWYLKQDIKIKNVDLIVYFDVPINEQTIYKAYYLPFSKYCIYIKPE